MDTRKRAGINGNGSGNGGSFKKPKTGEMVSTGIGSKTKPCTKFFSTNGCQYGEDCIFAHYVPGGYSVVAQMSNMGPSAIAPLGGMVAPPPMKNRYVPPAIKSRLCHYFNSAEGCKSGDKCRFAHGEWEIRKPVTPSFDDHQGMRQMPGRGGRMMEQSFPPPVSAFGASSTTKISVDAALVGPIVGKGGVNSEQIRRHTGVKFVIRDHETDPNLRNIKLEGSLEQIDQASAMIREHVVNVSRTPSKYKTKLCEKFSKGSCTLGDKCSFAHGAAELRTTI